MKRLSFILLLGLLGFQQARSQSQDDIQTPKIVPPSPDAAALGKYGEIPVDKSTGVPSISIPLYEIKTPRFNMPISLSYHASGIKVEEISSWVGAGWTLNAGGTITRCINGLPDDGGFGYLTNHASIIHAANIQWPANILYISQVVTKQLDLQPDNFYYNFNNYAGAFVFGDDTKPLLIPYQPIKINFDQSTKNFSVVDEQGNFYNFNTQENVTSSIANMSGISSWYLTQMISADLSDTVNFMYTQDATPQTTVSYNFSQSIGDCGSSSTYNLQPMTTTSSSRQYNCIRISSIQFKGGKVDFKSQGGRLDDGITVLDSVIVSNQNPASNQYQRIKSFSLLTGYTYSTLPYPSTITLAESDKYRLFLYGLQENDQNNVPVKTHQFAYNSTMLPSWHSYAQDNWGYFNGQTQNPSLLQSQLVIVQNNGLPNVVDTVGNALGGDRSVSPTFMQAGVLQQITYPTKGYTLFTYDCNKQEGIATSAQTFNASGIGLHVQMDTIIYTPNNGMLISGGNIFHVKLNGGNTNPGYPLSYVKMINIANGSTVFSLTGNSSKAVDTMVGLASLPLSQGNAAPVSYQLIAVAVGGTSPTSDSLPYAIITTTCQTPNGSNLINAGGLRVSAISNYNADGGLAAMQTYKYGNNDQSGGGVQLSLSLVNEYTHTTACDISSGPINYTSLGTAVTYSNNSYYPLASFNGSSVAYPSVTLYHGDSLHNAGKSVYSYSVYPDSSVIINSNAFNGVKPVPVTWKYGDPISEAHYRNIGTNLYALLQSKTTTDSLIYKRQATGTVIEYNPEIIGNANNCGVFVNPYVSNNQVYVCAGSPWLPTYFYWFDYPISSGVRVHTTTSINNYDTTGTQLLMTSSTRYFYDDTTLYLPTRTVTSDSKGHSVEIHTYRPLDQALINALTPLGTNAVLALDSMVSRNILTPVVQQVQYRNGNFTELTLTNYNNWSSSVIAPQNVQTQLTPNPLDPRLQYNAYDARGNPLEVQKTNDVKEVYLWGYQGQYPVAKILNTTYAVASTYITQTVLDNPSSDVALRSQLSNLRNIPGALVTSYTYAPLIGVTSVTDPQGRITYYEYDAFNRLKDIKDLSGNIIKTYDYHYAQ